jgi:hypothetical protein
MNSLLKLFLWILFSLISAQVISAVTENAWQSESFTLLKNAEGKYPDKTLLLDDKEETMYELSGNTEISSNTAADIWQYYPIFNVGSYTQITNNLKYPINPDNGKCMPASMCETLYLDRITGPPNEISPLPPVSISPDFPSVRVNYYIAKE